MYCTPMWPSWQVSLLEINHRKSTNLTLHSIVDSTHACLTCFNHGIGVESAFDGIRAKTWVLTACIWLVLRHIQRVVYIQRLPAELPISKHGGVGSTRPSGAALSASSFGPPVSGSATNLMPSLDSIRLIVLETVVFHVWALGTSFL